MNPELAVGFMISLRNFTLHCNESLKNHFHKRWSKIKLGTIYINLCIVDRKFILDKRAMPILVVNGLNRRQNAHFRRSVNPYYVSN